MPRLSLVLVFSFFFTFISAEEKQIILKDYLYTKKNSIALSDLVGIDSGVKEYISVLSNLFLPNADIHAKMTGCGMSDYVLIGSGTYIIRIDTLSSVEDVKTYTAKALEGEYSVKTGFSTLELPGQFKILNISNEIISNTLTLFIDYVYFEGDNGIVTNRIFNLSLETSARPEGPGDISGDISYIDNLDMGSADMINSRGNIFIKMKVRVIRKLEDGTCLVENYSSGRVFRMKLREPM